ncbi:glycosyltransferase family 39 protein [candidate division KSB1 bacterium]|nr:glycosyltransferase family 39 protein [candidate division KSB1 bacterium]
MMDTIKNRKALLAIIGVGLIVRILFVLAFPNIGTIDAMDSAAYNAVAVNITKGLGFTQDGVNPTLFLPPAYPAFLSSIYFLFGHSTVLVELIQCLLNVGIACVTFLLAREFFSEAVAAIACLIALFHPEIIALTSFLYTETVFIFLFICLIYFTVRFYRTQKMIFLILAAVTGGICTLTRGITLYFPVIFFSGLIFVQPFKKAALNSALFSIFLCMTIAPWTIRNYRVSGSFTPVSVGLGYVLWAGNYLPFDGEYEYHKTQALADSMTNGMTFVERERFFTAEAKQNMKRDVAGTAKLWVKKLFRYWSRIYSTVPDGTKHAGKGIVYYVLLIIHLMLLFFFLPGILRTRNRWKEFMLIYLIFLYMTAIHVITLPWPRYRIPLIPFMGLFAAVEIVHLFNEKIKNRRKKRIHELPDL